MGNEEMKDRREGGGAFRIALRKETKPRVDKKMLKWEESHQ